jgi:hypothetical protein
VSRWLAIFFTLKIEAIRSSEMSVHTSTRRHIPQDGILQGYDYTPTEWIELFGYTMKIVVHALAVLTQSS